MPEFVTLFPTSGDEQNQYYSHSTSSSRPVLNLTTRSKTNYTAKYHRFTFPDPRRRRRLRRPQQERSSRASILPLSASLAVAPHQNKTGTSIKKRKGSPQSARVFAKRCALSLSENGRRRQCREPRGAVPDSAQLKSHSTERRHPASLPSRPDAPEEAILSGCPCISLPPRGRRRRRTARSDLDGPKHRQMPRRRPAQKERARERDSEQTREKAKSVRERNSQPAVQRRQKTHNDIWKWPVSGRRASPLSLVRLVDAVVGR